MLRLIRLSVCIVVVAILCSFPAQGQFVNGGGNNTYTLNNLGVGINPAAYGVPLVLYSSTLPFFIIDSGGSCGACNPSFAFELGGVAKGFVGAVAANNNAVTGGLTGDIYVRSQSGGRLLFSVDSGATSAMTITTAGVTMKGTVSADNIIAKYQDVAEWVPSAEPLDAGTVVVLDSTHSNRVTASGSAYDTRVAGVVSDKPGFLLGEESATKEKVATTGRVKVKVDASYGTIHIGDLLVSSPIAGTAMVSSPVEVAGIKMHRPGTIIGKALEPMVSGRGEILVLLSLQ